MPPYLDFKYFEQSIISFPRRDRGRDDMLFETSNSTPVPGERCRVGVPRSVRWCQDLNLDTLSCDGGAVDSQGGSEAGQFPFFDRRGCISLGLPLLDVGL